MRGKAACVMLALAAMVLAGCANLGEMTLTPCDDEPGWVSRGSGEFGHVEERQIYGVGSAFGGEKEKDAAAMAKKQAQMELRSQLKGWIKATNSRMTREMSEHFEDGEKAAASFFRRATQDLASAAAERGEVRSRWSCGVTDEAFSLMAITEARMAAMYRKNVSEMAAEKGADVLSIKPAEFSSMLRGKNLAESGPTGDLTK